jgi:hypothetical protein
MLLAATARGRSEAMPRRVARMLLALAAGLAAAACSSNGNGGGPAPAAGPASCAAPFRGASARTHPAWIIAAGALSRLRQAGLPYPLFRAQFNRPGTLVLVSHGRTDSLVPRASLGFYYTSAGAMMRAVLGNQVPANVRYLLVDPERWPLTPAAEQHDPIGALKAAAAVAHAHGKCVVFAPAVDLVGVNNPGEQGAGLYSAFNELLIGPGAVPSDMLAVQAQHTEGTAYANSFAPRAIRAAQAAHPGEPVLVGLSTNPNGRQVSPAHLFAVYRAGAAAGAAGYWLNIPASGAECPRCGSAQPQVAVAFLEALAGRRTGILTAAVTGSRRLSGETIRPRGRCSGIRLSTAPPACPRR